MSKKSAPAPKSKRPPITVENNVPVPPQAFTPTTTNYSAELAKLRKGQCYRIKNYDLYMRMRAAAHTQNSKYGSGYVCRWLGSFGRIWRTVASKKR